MREIIALIITTIAGLSTVIGGCIVFFKIKNKEKFISFCLSFSLSVMITISIIDLLPSSFIELNSNFSLIKSIIITVVLFMIGAILVSILDRNIKVNKSKDSNLFKLGILNMIALMLHNFPEGIATFMTSYSDLSIGISLSLAIMMHNIPEGISIAVPLYYSTGKKGRGILYTFISALAEPLGAIVAFLFLKQYINMLTISYVLIIVAGIMITISINELYPEAIKYNERKQIKLGMLLGVVIILINHFLF